MHKLKALIVGAIAMAPVYGVGVAVCDHLVELSGRSPESYLWLAFLVFAPLACLAGGYVSAIVAGPFSKRPISDAFFLSPGTYQSLVAAWASISGGSAGFAAAMLFPSILWIAASVGGFTLGRAVLARRAAAALRSARA
jgi:hypothetical protein